MLIWTITTAFSGVYQPLHWLENVSGSTTERRLVWILLWLSVGGMVGNVSCVLFGSYEYSYSKGRLILSKNTGRGCVSYFEEGTFYTIFGVMDPGFLVFL